MHLLLFAAIIAIPLLALLGAMFYRSAVQEHRRLERLIGQELAELIASLERDIERRTAVLQTLATAPALEAEDWASFHRQAKASLGKNYLVLTDSTGRQLVNTFVPHGTEPGFTGDLATIETMRRSMRPVVSNLFTSPVAKRPVYNVSIPIPTAGGTGLRYAMSLGLFPEDLRRLLQDQHLAADWTTEIWDRKGVILAHSHEQERRLGETVPERWREQPLGRVVQGRSLDGERVLVASDRTATGGWTVRVSVPARLVDATTRELLWAWGVAAALVTLLTGVTAYVFGVGFTGPLGATARGAAALGRGDPVEVGDTRIVEVNAVNHALREAAERLEQSRTALRYSEQLLGTAADVAHFGAHQYDAVHDRVHRSPQIRRILGVGPGEDRDLESALDFVHPDDRKEVGLRKRQILASEQQYQLTYRIRRPDGEVRWVMDRGQVERDAAGKALRVVGLLVDITDLKEAEERQRLLFEELNHRVKNTLAIVQSLAQQTQRSKSDPQEFTRAFGERIMALSRAHDLLTRTAWRGALLNQVVSAVLDPFSAYAGRIEVSGDAVELPTSITIALALMLNELATNAAKFGALSIDAGRIEISWTVTPMKTQDGEGVVVDFIWQEHEGPPVAPPKHRGFGSRLLAASAQQIKGELDAQFAPEGLRCRLRFPVPARTS
ncbi:MAG: PAS domain-containing protein [Enhydrobacter sp.]|nr:PAS domain-containing protein [Enhydrobacter sp.]